MKIFKKLAGFALCAVMAATAIASSSAQSVSAAATKTSAQIVSEMGIGWNLGNSLDTVGAGNTLSAETYWGNPKTTKALIDKVADAGFTTIRIPVSWGEHTTGTNYTINSAWMARVKEVVDYCIDDGLYVILNVHHDNSTTYYYPSTQYQTQSEKFLTSIWSQISTAFNGYDQKLIFETMNEPRLVGHTNEWWFNLSSPQTDVATAITLINGYNQKIVNTIRNSGGNNTNRLIMVPGYDASVDGATVSTFKMPTDSSNMLAVSIHAYTPYNFAMNCGNGSTSTFSSSIQNEQATIFNNIKTKLLDKGYQVVIGEFGCTNKNNTAERVKWANYYTSKCIELGIPCMLWDNNANGTSNGYSERLGFINRSTLSYYDSTYAAALLDPYANSDKISIAGATCTLSATSYTFTGTEKKPSVTVKLNGIALKKGTDYSVSYLDNINAGTATVTIRGIGAYNGSISKTFKINAPAVGTISNLKATPTTSSSVKLSWKRGSSCSGANIYYYNGSSWVNVGRGTTSKTVTGLSAGKTYKFKAIPYYKLSSQTFNSSSSVTCSGTTRPADVTGVKSIGRDETGIRLSWNKNSTATAYVIYQYNSSTSTWVRKAETTSTAYTIRGLTAGNSYKFCVKAYKTYNNTKYYCKSFKSLTACTSPKAPSYTVTTGSGKVNFKWSKVNGATGYCVFVRTSSTGSWTRLCATKKATSHSQVLTKGKTYYVMVRAYKTVNGVNYYGKYTQKKITVK